MANHAPGSKHSIVQSKTKFLMTSFINDEMKLQVYESFDGVNFRQRQDINYVPQQGNQTVRDPSITKIGEYYYIVYTVIDWGTGDFYKVWAPAFYTEGDNTYIIINANESEEDQNFQSYILQYDAEEHALSEVRKLEGLPANVIDAQIYKTDGMYYVFYKNEDTKYIELACASNLTGVYEIVGQADWAGWGNSLEGPALIQLENGTYRLYMDNYEEHQIYYSDSTSLTEGWTQKCAISPDMAAHPDVKIEFADCMEWTAWEALKGYFA
jgi:hypothetical protein